MFQEDDMTIALYDRHTRFEIHLICLRYDLDDCFYAILTSDNDCDPDHPALETAKLGDVIEWLNTPYSRFMN